MSDFNEPTNTSLYSGIWANVRGLISSCIKLDPSSDSNIPTGAIKFNTSTNVLQRWNGSAYVDVLPASATWTPTYGALGSMTYTSVTTTVGKYWRHGSMVFFRLNCTGTTG